MSLEQEVAHEMRKTRMRIAVLSAVELAGTLAILAIAPNVLGVLGKARKRWSGRNIRSVISRLHTKGFVRIERGCVHITELGTRYLDSCGPRASRPRTWDRKWRVVVFDIPEQQKRLRDALRSGLRQIGFIRLQHSVWVYPFDCEELVALLKMSHHAGKSVLYMIVDRIENDAHLRTFFNLQK